MIKIKKSNFSEKFTEINIRQRMYNGESIVTLMISTEFYPSLVGESVVSGVIEIKLDVADVKSLDGLVGKDYKGDIGSVSISVNNDGIWEHQSVDSFEIRFLERDKRKLKFELKTSDCVLKTSGVMVSLYSTSSTIDGLNKVFDLSDFYDRPIIKEVGNSKILKYFVKE